MVAVLVVAAASVSLGYGVVYARGQLKAIAIKHRALDEVTSYMELWVSRFHDNHISASDLAGDRRGEEVIIYSPFSETAADELVDDVIKGTLYRSKSQKKYSSYNPAYFGYYNLEVWIEWVDPFCDPEKPHEIRLSTNVIPLQ